MLYLGAYRLLSLRITACDYDFLIDKAFRLRSKRCLVAPIALHPVMIAYLHPELTRLYEKFDYLVPDGQYVRWLLNAKHRLHLKDRVYGPTLFDRLCQASEIKGKKLFLCGNNAAKVVRVMKKRYPRLNLVYQDLYGKIIDDTVLASVQKNIQRENIDIVVIGIGSPKQHMLAVGLTVRKPIFCVGAAFDFISHAQRQAPKWMGDNGLEWLFRLAQNPLYFSRRYVLDTAAVLLKLTRQYFQKG